MKDYGIKLGTILYTMVEPHRGHEVEYNRWYERDHFYAGCMIGTYNFAGQRWVATRECKARRYPAEANAITPAPSIGSYLALYWILADHHDDWNRWAVDQVNWLHANGRMFAERDHIHTLLYKYEWAMLSDPEGPSPELALDHRYPGLAVVVTDAAEGVDAAQVEAWYREQGLPEGVGQRVSFSPLPLLGDAPGDVPRTEAADRRSLHLCFLDVPPGEVWDRSFAEHGAELSKAGIGSVVWASPFVPTVPGTDTYTDQLW